MADISLKVKLETELGKVGGDIEKLKGAGAFSGEKGAKSLNKIQGLLASLQAVDLSKLKGPELTNFLNNLSKLRHFLDSAAKGLTNFSANYKTALDKVEKATLAAAQAQDKVTRALERQKTAQSNLNLDKDYAYKNASGRRISNPDTLATEYTKGTLKVFNKEGIELTGASKTAHLGRTGIAEYAAATKEVADFKAQLDVANEALKKVNETLEKTPTGSDINPITKDVVEASARTNAAISGIKTDINAATEQDISTTNHEIENLNSNLTKQSSSLGKAFRQFTLYAVALRMVKKALHEAVGTIRDLDKYLTEQAMVTGKTRKETYALLQQYQDMAVTLGATTKEVAEVATQFMRQGKTTADALKLTEAAISAAKIAGISATDSVNYLTTALNGFQLSAEQAMRVSDRFAAIAAQSATSYEEIATALSKVAAQANMAGMSIDYTTALLAKGIETTREAPETIGTALKTIIARMRELTDYGATLEDGMSINNVEEQLAYVGIKLRDTNGELRSTEDVLNDLGQAWDTLSTNQQAAIAKALAGTRQQSRLIAMMADYDRVLELQQIAERSTGATAAQAATYLEGMEAALNRVSVAWEKIVTTFTNSDVIINLINGVASLLDNLGSFMNTTQGMVTMMTTLSILGLTILSNKMQELYLAKLQKQYTFEENKQQNLKNIALTKENIEKFKIAKQNAKSRLDAALERKAKLGTLAAVIQEYKLKGAIVTASEAWLKKEQAANEEEIVAATTEYNQATLNLNTEENRLSIMEQQQGILNSQAGLVASIGTGILGMLLPLKLIIGFITAIKVGLAATKVYQDLLNQGLDKQKAKEAKNNALAGAGMFAKIVSAFSSAGIPGVIAGIALATTLAAALGVAIAASVGAFNQPSATDTTVEDVNKLSNAIYKMTERANNLKTLIQQYDELDNKLIKTIEDQKTLNDLLDQAADKLSDEGVEGQTDRDIYNSLQDNATRRRFIEAKQQEYQNLGNLYRLWQLNLINSLNSVQRQLLLNANSTSAAVLQMQSALFATNNQRLYEYVDTLQDVAEGVEAVTQNILEAVSPTKALALANDLSATAIHKLVDALNNENAAILNSDSGSLREHVEAYQALQRSVMALGDEDLTKAFNEVYQQWDQIATKFGASLDFLDKYGVTIDKFNEFGSALKKAGIDAEQASDKINQLFSLIESGADLGLAIRSTFAVELAKAGDEAEELYNKLVNAYGVLTTKGILNTGQNMTTFYNKINKLYEAAGNWSSMTIAEQTEFLSDNAALFEGEDGAALLQAIKTQNYEVLEKAIKNNQAMKEETARRLQELQSELAVELAKNADKQNQGYIAFLKDQIKALEDYESETTKLYRVSTEIALEQENKQLDAYKDMLKKQQDALTKSLEDRRDAYSKYFDAINQQYEEEEYEKQAQLLMSNIAKIGVTDAGESRKQQMELTAQLADLEEERLKTLRQQAQEAVVQNIDNEVSQINDKFDKLLESNKDLLAAMTAEITGDATEFATRMLASGMQNQTYLGAQSFLEEFQTTFGSRLSSDVLDNIRVTQDGAGNIILNVNGQTINLSETQNNDLYAIIYKALRDIGQM